MALDPSKRALAAMLVLSFLIAPLPAPHATHASTYLTDSASHPPPTTGSHAYYATAGTFGPDQAGFPAVGGTFVDPVFGGTIRRLTNELGLGSFSEIYAKNGFLNADGTLMYHRAPDSRGGRTIVNTTTGQVLRTNVPGNFDSSFAPDDPDVWYWFSWGGIALNRYRVSTGTSTLVKNFSAALGQLGGSVDWIDGSGRYMVLHLGTALRVYDVQSDILYAGSIPESYGGGSGWTGISPDGNYVVTATDGQQHNSFRIDHVNRSVTTTPTLFWTLCGDHGDLVSASNGKTYFVTHECWDEGALYAVDVSLAQSASNRPKQRADNRKLLQLSSWSDVAGHFSGVSKGALRDWMFTSVNSGDDGFTGAVSPWRPYKAEIMMINVVTGDVRRLAHHRSRSLSTSYYYTPRVSASYDGSVVTWASNFGYSGNGYADIYAMRIDAGGTPPPPPPPPPASTPSLSLAYTGKLRDRVGQGNTALGADGAMDGAMTVTLSASGGKTVTGLTLQSTAPGTWDTASATGVWALGVATGLDAPLVNNGSTMGVSFVVADGGSFVLFASDYNGIEFVPGVTLTVTATFSDGTSATAATTVGGTPPPPPPPPPASTPSLSLAYNGKLRDRVGQGNTALGADGALDGALTATLSATGGRTVTGLTLQSTAPGTWDTNGTTGFWALGVAASLDGPVLNSGSTMAVSFPVANGGSFVVFGSDWGGVEFLPGVTLTLTATFSDGTTATATTTAGGSPPPPPPPPVGPASLTLAYNGKLRDRVGQGNTALGGDGALDGTLTATLSASGGRTVTGVTLQSTAPGTWDTVGTNGFWALGVATALDGPLLNNGASTAVTFAVADGGSFIVFASDWGGIEFVPGVTLSLTATFSDGTTVTAVKHVP